LLFGILIVIVLGRTIESTSLSGKGLCFTPLFLFPIGISVSNEDLQQQLSLLYHELTNRIPKVINTIITPSEYAKSTHNDVFREVLDLCGFGNGRLMDRVQRDLAPLDLANRPLLNDWNFNFNFRDKKEEDSYGPLQLFLTENNLHVKNVTSGEGLIDGLLFEQELWTLKKNLMAKSCDLGPLEQCICKFIVRGRTDFVRLQIPQRGITRINNQYFIEIKKGTIGESELKEAFYQLIGGNAANPYRSPPVFITNLNSSHYILFISFIGESSPDYQLNIFQFVSFGQALNYLEDETREVKSWTRDFLRRPTPLSSPVQKQMEDEDLDDFDSKISLQPVHSSDDWLVGRLVGSLFHNQPRLAGLHVQTTDAERSGFGCSHPRDGFANDADREILLLESQPS
jgi:hypothetical protein